MKLRLEVFQQYIQNIKGDWNLLRYYPKLSQEEIKLTPDELVKMYLYAFYFYPEIYTYSLDKLKISINSSGFSLYLLGCSNGWIELLEYLETKGFDVNYFDKHGDNGYMYATFYQQLNVIKHLDSKGNFINIKRRTGYNAYFVAIQKNNIIILKYFDMKHNFAKITDKGETVQKFSINNSSLSAIKYLLESKYKLLIKSI
jgi:ankyrin repeat protein